MWTRKRAWTAPKQPLQGAKDIVAELVSDAPKPRGLLRTLAEEEGLLETRAAKK